MRPLSNDPRLCAYFSCRNVGGAAIALLFLHYGQQGQAEAFAEWRSEAHYPGSKKE